MKRMPKTDGFTLLEILIALAILAILMTGLLKIASDNTRNLWHIENKTIAAIIAANHAAQLRLAQEKPEQDDGWETQAGRRWYWQANGRSPPRWDFGDTKSRFTWKAIKNLIRN